MRRGPSEKVYEQEITLQVRVARAIEGLVGSAPAIPRGAEGIPRILLRGGRALEQAAIATAIATVAPIATVAATIPPIAVAAVATVSVAAISVSVSVVAVAAEQVIDNLLSEADAGAECRSHQQRRQEPASAEPVEVTAGPRAVVCRGVPVVSRPVEGPWRGSKKQGGRRSGG